jgi:hypothetical protein
MERRKPWNSTMTCSTSVLVATTGLMGLFLKRAMLSSSSWSHGSAMARVSRSGVSSRAITMWRSAKGPPKVSVTSL